jgi:hypothetical protein
VEPPLRDSELWPVSQLLAEILEMNSTQAAASLRFQFRSERRRHSVNLASYIGSCLQFQQKLKDLMLEMTADRR